jgi:hypothetical protein
MSTCRVKVQMIDEPRGAFGVPEFYDLTRFFVGKNPEHVNARGGLLVRPQVATLQGECFQIAELLH